MEYIAPKIDIGVNFFLKYPTILVIFSSYLYFLLIYTWQPLNRRYWLGSTRVNLVIIAFITNKKAITFTLQDSPVSSYYSMNLVCCCTLRGSTSLIPLLRFGFKTFSSWLLLFFWAKTTLNLSGPKSRLLIN